MTSPGWAGTSEPLRERLAYLPYGPEDPEPAYAIADAWSPPHELSLPASLCDAVLASRGDLLSPAATSGNGDYYAADLGWAERDAVVDRFAAANNTWWGLDLDEWQLAIKRYRPGDRHVEHQDLHAAGGARRKLAGVVQLSEPDDYQGGALVMRFAHHRTTMPRARGTLVAFPGWTLHEVEPVVSGERWMLAVNGWGSRLR
jgi:2OG-Fe(II) oxygenase superfamily